MPEPIRQIDPVNPATGRWWRGRPLSPVMEAQMFFDDQGPVPETGSCLNHVAIVPAEG